MGIAHQKVGLKEVKKLPKPTCHSSTPCPYGGSYVKKSKTQGEMTPASLNLVATQ